MSMQDCLECGEEFAGAEEGLCPDCAAYEEQLADVIEGLGEDYPGTVEYTVSKTQPDHFDLLDKDDKVVATIHSDQMTRRWN